MRYPSKRVARLLFAACAAVLVSTPVLVAAPVASAQVECWKRLLNDWYDGQIENTYELECYQQAINHLPADVEQYSSARDDIQRALQAAIAARNAQSSGTTTDSSSVIPPPPTTTSPQGTTTTTPATDGREEPKGPIANAIDKLNPGSADAFPLPLLVLGALAIALVIAGVVGMIWRRAQDDGTANP